MSVTANGSAVLVALVRPEGALLGEGERLQIQPVGRILETHADALKHSLLYLSTKNDHLKLDGYEGGAWTVAQLSVFDIYSFRTIFAVSVWRALRSTRAFKCLDLGIRRNGVASSAYWRTPLML